MRVIFHFRGLGRIIFPVGPYFLPSVHSKQLLNGIDLLDLIDKLRSLEDQF